MFTTLVWKVQLTPALRESIDANVLAMLVRL